MKYKIMLEISNCCKECPLREKCIEIECVLFRIEKILENMTKNKKGELDEIM